MIYRESIIKKVCIFSTLAFLTLLAILPLIWMLSASLKYDSQVFSLPIRWIPEDPVWNNYVKFWTKLPFVIFTFNSFKLSIIVTVIQVLTCSFAAYGFAKCHFPGRDTLFFLYIATIAIPWQVYMLPQYIEMRMLGLVNSHLG